MAATIEMMGQTGGRDGIRPFPVWFWPLPRGTPVALPSGERSSKEATMRTNQTLATLMTVAALAGVGEAQPVRPDAGPVRPSSPGVRVPREAPASRDGLVRVEIDGIEGLVPALGLDQDFAIGDSSGRRLPQATITLTREPDEFTAALLRGHTRGTRYREVVIASPIVTAGARSRLTIRLSDVVVEAVRLRSAADGAQEAVTLRFGRIAWSFDDGSGFDWNYATMSAR
jgi:hypothetical protein